MSINPLLNQFLEELETKNGLSAQTVANYHFYLRRFLNWSKIKRPDDISLELIEKYKQWLGQQKLEPSTQNYHLIALRSWLAFLNRQNKNVPSPHQVTLAKIDPKQVNVLSGADIEKLLKVPLETKEKRIIQLRDKTLLEILFSAGLKVSELARLLKKNVSENKLVIIKKNQKHQVNLNNQSLYWLKKYLNERKDNAPYLFIRFDRAANKKTVDSITARSVQRLIHKYAKAAGLSRKVTPQLLRNSVAHQLLSQGNDLQTVKRQLGHASLITTQRYIVATELDN